MSADEKDPPVGMGSGPDCPEEAGDLDARLDALGAFAGRLAHEFNNVINSIMNTAALLKIQGGLPPDAAELVNLIDQSTRRGAELTAALTGFSRPVRPQFRALDAWTLLESATTAVRKRMPPKVTVDTVMATESPGVAGVRVDELLFVQMLSELALSAAEAMGGEGKIVFSLEQPAGSGVVRIAVTDTGPAIPAADRPRIFDPFYSARTGGKISGPGLSHAWRLAHDQNGRLRLAPRQPLRGATFHIELPLVAASGETAPAAPAGSAPLKAPGGPVRILLADDDEPNRLLGSRLLEKFGHKVTLARDGLETVQIFQSQAGSFDLIIVDENMPGLTGTEVISIVRKEQPAFPAILITGDDVTGSTADDGVIRMMKPYDTDRFLEAIAVATRRKGP